ncbi:MAG: hypothetical protein K0B81_09055 [Candidatus Cloacimonetes bacterium]|nr:hypothetical protein [Candidatus Cloacimonadota bacterium]
MAKIYDFLLKNRVLILFILFVFSFALRVSLTYREYSLHGTSYWQDALYYLNQGVSFAEGDFYPDFGPREVMRSGPVLPIIVAFSKLVTGDPIWLTLVFNCLFSALLVYVLFWIGFKLVGLTAGYLMALWSVFNISIIKFNYQILKEPLIFLLLPLAILCLINIYQKRNILLNVILSSFIFSLLIHTDERFFIYTPVFLLCVFFVSQKKLKIQHSFLWLLVLVVTMIPWTIRNYKQFGEIMILTPRTTAFTSKIWGTDFAKVHFDSEEGIEQEITRREEYAVRAADRFGVEPRRFGKYEKYLKSFQHYWQPTFFRLTYIQYGFRPVKWSLAHNTISILFYGIFLPFYILGILFAAIRKKWLIIFLAALPFIHSLLHAYMIWPLERYRLPMNFLVVLVALWFFLTYILKSKNVEINKKIVNGELRVEN